MLSRRDFFRMAMAAGFAPLLPEVKLPAPTHIHGRTIHCVILDEFAIKDEIDLALKKACLRMLEISKLRAPITTAGLKRSILCPRPYGPVKT